MGYRATHRFARIAPTKVRPVARLIARQNVETALGILSHLPHRGARFLKKVLQSALADAEYRGARDIGDMVVAEVRIDEGPRIPRVQPRARGMGFKVLRRMSHIQVTIDAPEAGRA